MRDIEYLELFFYGNKLRIESMYGEFLKDYSIDGSYIGNNNSLRIRSFNFLKKNSVIENNSVETFGEMLFDSVFHGEILGVYSQILFKKKKTRTIIKINITYSPELTYVPWELMFDHRGNPLALSNSTPIIREFNLPQSRDTLIVNSRTINILFIISEASNINSHQEWMNIKRTFSSSSKRGEVKISRISNVNIKSLREELIYGEYNVIHFIGHSDFDKSDNTGKLALESTKGKVEFINADSLGSLLNDNQFVQLFVLNSCNSAENSVSSSFNGIAQCLIKSGVPAVIAMQRIISDESAIIFSDALYRTILLNKSIDIAVTEARKAIYSQSSLKDEWFIPVLYTRSRTGFLFEFKKAKSWIEILRENKKDIGYLLISSIAGLLLIGGTIFTNKDRLVYLEFYSKNGKSVSNLSVEIPEYGIKKITNRNGKVSYKIPSYMYGKKTLIVRDNGVIIYNKNLEIGVKQIVELYKEK